MRHPLQDRRIISYAIALGLALSAPIATLWSAKPPVNDRPLVLSITVSGGHAWVDDAALLADANLYAGERVRLETGTTAMLRIPGGFALVGAGSAFRVESGGLQIERGKFQLRQEVPSPFAIESKLFHARVGASGSAARAEFVTTETGGRITSLAGIVELTATGDATTYRLHPGESALLGDQVAQAVPANASAGAVTRFVSPVEVDRGTQQLPAALQSPVFWNDLLHSGRQGARAWRSMTAQC